ncbi:MAG: hypothetical protein Q8R00_03660 [Candidatus Nanoarchaeia archaeon]|nr:hypothetical protein [Candidatus Nanoarchaeia archaeon]
MNKKGVDLTLNTVILGILVVLVLIVVVTFFLGGTAGLTKTVREVFYGTTAGTSEVIAVETCHQRCDQAKLLPDPSKSAFCTADFDIDRDNDGKVEGDDEIGVFCEELGVTCGDICKAQETVQPAA